MTIEFEQNPSCENMSLKLHNVSIFIEMTKNSVKKMEEIQSYYDRLIITHHLKAWRPQLKSQTGCIWLETRISTTIIMIKTKRERERESVFIDSFISVYHIIQFCSLIFQVAFSTSSKNAMTFKWPHLFGVRRLKIYRQRLDPSVFYLPWQHDNHCWRRQTVCVAFDFLLLLFFMAKFLEPGERRPY